MESVTPEPVTPALLWALAAHLVFAATSIWLVVVDLREHRLPNRIVAWSTGGILALFIASSAINAASEAAQPWNKLLVSVLSGVGYGLVFFLLWFFAPRALGAGGREARAAHRAHGGVVRALGGSALGAAVHRCNWGHRRSWVARSARSSSLSGPC